MPYIPEQHIPLKIEDAVQRQRQFHYAQIACQMPAGLTDRIENKLPYLIGKLLQLGNRQPLYVSRTFYLIKKFAHQKLSKTLKGNPKHQILNKFTSLKFKCSKPFESFANLNFDIV